MRRTDYQLGSLTVTNGATQVSKLTYAFDNNGNRTSQTDQNNAITSLRWDQSNRMTAYGTATYAYNGDGLRTAKTVSGTVEAFTWDVADGLPLILKDGSTNFVTGLGGLPLEEITSSGAVHYYHQDQLGSTVALTDSTGTRIGSQSYSAYGTIASSSGVAPVLAYAGQYRDPESGLYYLRARYYDPASGQFISRDPHAEVTRQSFAYAGDSPTNVADPSGLDWRQSAGDVVAQAWSDCSYALTARGLSIELNKKGGGKQKKKGGAKPGGKQKPPSDQKGDETVLPDGTIIRIPGIEPLPEPTGAGTLEPAPIPTSEVDPSAWQLLLDLLGTILGPMGEGGPR